MNARQKVFATTIREYMLSDSGGEPCHIQLLYEVVAERHPDLIDTARRPPPHDRTLRWHHDVQWALKNLIAEHQPDMQRRTDRGRGWYSLT